MATYKIVEGEEGFDCQVLHYNDGTRIINNEGSAPMYLFKNVNAQSIDGNTGATGKKGSKSKSSSFSIELLGPNRLKVIQHISGQKRTEIWKRNQFKKRNYETDLYSF